jgi:hypothetical protein
MAAAITVPSTNATKPIPIDSRTAFMSFVARAIRSPILFFW